MPTKAPDSPFDPDHFKVQISTALNIAKPLLEELRNYGLAALARCSYRPGGGDENLAILLPYLHLIEMLDGVQILIAESSITPAKLQVRSMFEAALGIEYVSKENTIRRGLSYLFMDVISRLKSVKRLDSSTSEGEVFRKSLGAYASVIDKLPELKSRLDALNGFVQKPELKEIREEYDRLSKHEKKRISWYQLFDGPRNIRGLACSLGREAEYAVLYSYLSGTAHVEDAIRRRLSPAEGDQMALRPLREPTDIMSTLHMTVSYAVRSTHCVLRYYRPDEMPRSKEWYLREIKPLWDRLKVIRFTS